MEAEGAKQQPQVEQDAGPARGHLHPEGRPAAVCEGGLQHRILVAGGRGQLLGARGMPTRGIPAPAAPTRSPCVPAAAWPWARPTCHGAPLSPADPSLAHCTAISCHWQGLLVEAVQVCGCRAMCFSSRRQLSDTSTAWSRGPVRSAMLQPEPPEGVGWSWWGGDAEGVMMLGRG